MNTDKLVAVVAANLSSLLAPGQNYELLVLDPPKGSRLVPGHGIFSNFCAMAAFAIAMEREGYAVYFTLNRLSLTPTNTIDSGRAAEDKDVVERGLLLVDCDAQKAVKGGCSTDAEKAAAWEVAKAVVKELRALGWPEPTVCDSGNGWHLLYRVALPADDGGLVKRCLLALATRHKIDTVVHNPARITRCYGTLNCKGENTAERPHRRSRIIKSGSDAVVPLELLEALAAQAPATPATPTTTGTKADPQTAVQKARAAWAGRDRGSVVRHARAYLNKVPPAIEGQNGSGQAFRAACVLCVGFGLSAEEAAPLFAKYSDRCEPPWSPAEQSHKLADAAKKAEEAPDEIGHLLGKPTKGEEATKANGGKAKADGEDDKSSKRSVLFDIVEVRAELLHNHNGEPFARMLVPDRELGLDEEGQQQWHRETIAIESVAFQHRLQAAHMALHGESVSRHTLEEVAFAVAAKARSQGTEQEVFVRVAFFDGAVWLDLGDREWHAVRITAEDWEVVADCPVAFRRTTGMLALPTPVRGGNINELRPFVNVASDTDFRLAVAWAVMCFSPRGPYPLLALFGEQGSAKSSAMRVLLSLVDPNKVATPGTPEDDGDLCSQCYNRRVVSFDNLRRIEDWLSDALCRVLTGGGWVRRTLYTNTDQTIVEVCLPVVLSAINDVVVRGDLLDRTVLLRLPVIPEDADDARKDEEAFWQAFEPVRPRILGALLDGVVAALRNRPTVRIKRLPRMADFAKWAAAAAPAFGWTAEAFMVDYADNRGLTNLVALEHQLIAQHLHTVVRLEGGKWVGTAGQLLAPLRNAAVEAGVRVDKVPGWPQTPNALGAALVRLAPSLRRAGWTVEKPAGGGRRGRLWVLVLPAEETEPEGPESEEEKAEPVGRLRGWPVVG